MATSVGIGGNMTDSEKYGQVQTVKELRDILDQFPDSMPVWIDGYEGGIQRIMSIEPVWYVTNEWHDDMVPLFGPHEVATGKEVPDNAERGLYLSRSLV